MKLCLCELEASGLCKLLGIQLKYCHTQFCVGSYKGQIVCNMLLARKVLYTVHQLIS